MPKPTKNLLFLPSVVATFLLLILPQLKTAIDDVITAKRVNYHDVSNIAFLLITSASTLVLRYSESDDVHTAALLPGRNADFGDWK